MAQTMKLVLPGKTAAPKKPLRPMFIYTLNLSSWQARGKDDEITEDVKKQRGVAEGEDVGAFHKKFLKCPELDAMHTVLGKARGGFYLRTRPWGEVKQMRCGLVQHHIEMKQYVGDMQDELNRAWSRFAPVYLQRVEEQRFKLAGMFKSENYPSVAEVQEKFAIRLYTTTLSDPNDFRVLTDIPPEERDALIEETKKNLEITVKGAAKDALGRLYPTILKIAERLKTYDEKILKEGERKTPMYESMIENIRTMAEFAKRLNLEDDPMVNDFAAQAKKLVDGITVEDLKTADLVRKNVQSEAEQLAAKMTQFFGTA